MLARCFFRILRFKRLSGARCGVLVVGRTRSGGLGICSAVDQAWCVLVDTLILEAIVNSECMSSDAMKKSIFLPLTALFLGVSIWLELSRRMGVKLRWHSDWNMFLTWAGVEFQSAAMRMGS